MTKYTKTEEQIGALVAGCRSVFVSKNSDYGPTWRVYRAIALVDKIFIKLQRIRTLQENPVQLVQEVGDDINAELKGVVNYSIMAMINVNDPLENMGDYKNIDTSKLFDQYDAVVAGIAELRAAKNHDYGEAWRGMDVKSITDEMLVKVFRVKHMSQQEEDTETSEPPEENIRDICNYALFALVLRQEAGIE